MMVDSQCIPRSSWLLRDAFCDWDSILWGKTGLMLIRNSSFQMPNLYQSLSPQYPGVKISNYPFPVGQENQLRHT
jgi:hypothetical protein